MLDRDFGKGRECLVASCRIATQHNIVHTEGTILAEFSCSWKMLSGKIATRTADAVMAAFILFILFICDDI